MNYLVRVADNFHYMDDDETYDLGKFETAEEAITACKQIVDEFLVDAIKPGMTADKLYESYVTFGEDPYIIAPADAKDCAFSAWDYARERCRDLCNS